MAKREVELLAVGSRWFAVIGDIFGTPRHCFNLDPGQFADVAL